MFTVPRTADTGRHAVKGVGLQPLACWNGGLGSRREYRCLFLVSVVCIQVEVYTLSWLLVNRGHTECGVFKRDHESSTIKRPWRTRGCRAMGENIQNGTRNLRPCSTLKRQNPLLLHLIASLPMCDKWVPVTTSWRVLRLRMEERPPIWRVAANI